MKLLALVVILFVSSSVIGLTTKKFSFNSFAPEIEKVNRT